MKRRILKLLAVVTVFGGVFGMAASLGTLNSSTLGASDAAVGACDSNGVATAYTSAWDTTNKRYEISEVTVSGVNVLCNSLTLKVTLTDSTGAALGSGTLALPTSGAATSHTVTLSAGVSSAAAENVHVTIA